MDVHEGTVRAKKAIVRVERMSRRVQYLGLGTDRPCFIPFNPREGIDELFLYKLRRVGLRRRLYND